MASAYDVIKELIEAGDAVVALERESGPHDRAYHNDLFEAEERLEQAEEAFEVYVLDASRRAAQEGGAE